MIKRQFIALLMVLCTVAVWATTETNPAAVRQLATRVCGDGAATHIAFIFDTDFNDGAEAFQMGGVDGAVTITGNTLSALTTGLNWYLNHEAHVNLAWNNLTCNLTSFPAPSDQTVHQADGRYRYYLNYCTFSYSMAFWDWNRWQQEIDWMALHGVNLPLQVVGMDAVWYEMLTGHFGHSHDEASAFIAGPAHQGWFFMCNVQGTGGPNPAWWYKRQAELGRKITDRMRSLGMSPCLPGYYGMVTNKMADNKVAEEKVPADKVYHDYWWCGQRSPRILDHSQTAYFNQVAEQYYAHIQEVFGFTPEYYSIDPYHETDAELPTGADDYKGVCQNTWNALKRYTGLDNPVWVAQEWQTNANQTRINTLAEKGVNSLLLDLSSERISYYTRFGSQKYLFCVLNNYGGNIGMHGMVKNMVTRFASMRADRNNGVYSGVGVTAEGIENNPMIYDLLFELPWLGTSCPTTLDDAKTWVARYTEARYGTTTDNVRSAWTTALETVFNSEKTDQQGCREPVFCATPNLEGKDAYFWAKASYHWDKDRIIESARNMLTLDATLNTANYDYDVADFTRQALTDYAHTLQMDMAGSMPYTGDRFKGQAAAFLALMDDIDALLGTVEDFRLGRWVGMARAIAGESGDGWTAGDADWLEHSARMLLTTWFEDGRSLVDYANREYQGLISDYYKPRWQLYFSRLTSGQGAPDNVNDYNAKIEKPFVSGTATDAVYTPRAYGYYTAGQATGDTKAKATELMAKYFGTLCNGRSYSPWVTIDATTGNNAITVSGLLTADNVAAKLDELFTTKTTGSTIASYAFDMDMDGSFLGETEYTTGVPVCPNVDTRCRITMSDGAQLIVNVNVGEQEALTQFEHEGWTYTCTNVLTDITLTSATRTTGSGNITLPSTIDHDGNTYRVVALAPGFLEGNTSVTSITLPSTLARAGKPVFTATGSTTNNGQKFELAQSLGNEPWELTIRMHVGGEVKSGKNALFIMALMTGDNNIYSSFRPGLQFWHDWSDGKKTLAFTSDNIADALDPNGDGTGLCNSDATIVMNYAQGMMRLHITNDKGGDIKRTYAYTMPAARLNHLTIEGGAGTHVSSVTYNIPSKLSQNIVGNGVAQTINAPVTLTNDKNWTITARFQTDGSSFNQWGSGLLATGSNALATTYNNGFQYYLKKSGTIVYKINSSGDTHTSSFAVASNQDAFLTIDHVANGGTTFRMDQGANHDVYTTDGDVVFSDITTLASAIPTGIVIEDIMFDCEGISTTPLFNGCTALTAISVEDGNTHFAAEGGLLYDVNKFTLKRVPEGITSNITLASTLQRVADNAFLNSSAMVQLTADTRRLASIVPAEQLLLCLNSADDNAQWLNSLRGCRFGKIKIQRGTATGRWDAFVLPFPITTADIEANFGEVKTPKDLTVADGKVTLNFNSSVETVEAGHVFYAKTKDIQAAAVRRKARMQAPAVPGTTDFVFEAKEINPDITPTVLTDNPDDPAKATVTATITASYDNTASTTTGQASNSYVLSNTCMAASDDEIPPMTPVLTFAAAQQGATVPTPEYVELEGIGWSEVEQASEETRTDQYAKQVLINGIPVAGGENGYSAHPGFYVKTQIVKVPVGEDFTLRWLTNSNKGLAYTRATLYLDKNADYDFADDGECLGTLGSFCSNESAMIDKTLTISTDGLPLNTETVLRLRFDGTWIHPEGAGSGGYTNSSWFTPTASAQDIDNGKASYAFLPEAGATRVVYDIHIMVVEPWLTQFTHEGWTYTCTNESTNLTLTAATGNSGTMNIPSRVVADNMAYSIVALDKDFLKGNTDVTSITLPASITRLGVETDVYTLGQCTAGTGTGTGLGYNYYRLPQTITPEHQCWNLTVDITVGSTPANDWGTHLLAAKQNPFATTFPFLFYQNAERNGTNKYGDDIAGKLQFTVTDNTPANKHPFDFSLLGHSATFEFKYRVTGEGSGELNLTVVRDDGTTGTLTKSVYITENIEYLSSLDVNTINSLSYNFVDDDPANLTEAPFSGCTALDNISVDEANTSFSSLDGALFNKDLQLLLRMPANARDAVKAPEQLTMVMPGAFEGTTSLLKLTLPQYNIVDGVQAEHTSLALSQNSLKPLVDYMATIADNFPEVTIADRIPLADMWNTFCLPFALTADELSEHFTDVRVLSGITANGDNLTLRFTPVTGGMEAGVPYIVKGSGVPLTFTAKTVNAQVGRQTVSDNESGYTATMHGNYDWISAPKDCNCYIIADNKFYLVDSDVNLRGYRAYIQLTPPAGASQQVRQMFIGLDDLTEVALPAAQTTTAPCYDLSGRRVIPSTPGIYIVNGKKTVIK